jgi:hypothetical protein
VAQQTCWPEVRESKFLLASLQVVEGKVRQVINAKGMDKPVMVCRGIKRTHRGLLDVSEALEYGGIDKMFTETARNTDVPVDRIAKNFLMPCIHAVQLAI